VKTRSGPSLSASEACYYPRSKSAFKFRVTIKFQSYRNVTNQLSISNPYHHLLVVSRYYAMSLLYHTRILVKWLRQNISSSRNVSSDIMTSLRLSSILTSSHLSEFHLVYLVFPLPHPTFGPSYQAGTISFSHIVVLNHFFSHYLYLVCITKAFKLCVFGRIVRPSTSLPSTELKL
jgi:hypothetical protein